ncbi:MAG: DNA/RNA nuclease SfsA [Candidatus Ranarchaeia archaeon]|jgi:sugar fermentation stimulation protein A
MKYSGEYIFGEFRKRHNRFLADVKIKRDIVKVHVPDPGRLLELLKPGAQVFLRRERNPTRKTGFDLIGVKTRDIWVEIDSKNTNKLVEEDFHLLPFANQYKLKKREVNFGSSRLDFLLESKDTHEKTLMEVKSVTLVEGGVAKFPDAPTTRGNKHVLELIKAKEKGFRSLLLFVVKRHDAESVTVNKITDPDFSQTVAKALSCGVMVQAVGCRFTLKDLIIERELPFWL